MTKKTFPTLKDMEKIGTFVLRKKKKNIKELTKNGLAWTRTAWENKMDYEVNWLGVPIIQNPYDMVLMQELIFSLRPTVIVETGIAHGGSLIYYSSLLELLGKGRVVGVDVEIRSHNRKLIEKHPMAKRITMIEGSSVDPLVMKKVKAKIKKNDRVLVVLDSDHRRPHVLKELELYSKLVNKNSYVVVFDTFMPYLVGLEGAGADHKNNSAMDAVRDFMKGNKTFAIDNTMNKYFVSSCPDGFLKRLK